MRKKNQKKKTNRGAFVSQKRNNLEAHDIVKLSTLSITQFYLDVMNYIYSYLFHYYFLTRFISLFIMGFIDFDIHTLTVIFLFLN